MILVTAPAQAIAGYAMGSYDPIGIQALLIEEIVNMWKFRGVCLITRDVRKLREFYEAVLQVRAEGDDVFATFSAAGADLSIFGEQGMEQMAPGSMKWAGTGSYTLEFEVDDVDGEYERLSAIDVPIVKPPTTQPWGLRSVWFRDPDANIVNFFMQVAGQ